MSLKKGGDGMIHGSPEEEEEFYEDSVEDWELLGMDPDSSQEEIDEMWDNQM